MLAIAALLLAAPPAQEAELPVVRVEADDTVVDRSCRLVFPDAPIEDANGDGVVRIVGEDLVVRCEGRLRGAAEGVLPDAYSGTGIAIEGSAIALSGARVSGFRVGLLVRRSVGVSVADADVSDNFRQRLGSTYEREDSADWLWPHHNDEREWVASYGAGLCVERSTGVEVTRLFARDVQNGIVLDRVADSLVAGCDASFLSGWGLALWRSSDNRVVGNRFDFCVRGYSHGVYNRGQDSAGILLFEQSSRNEFLANSATHSGDGVFGFAGKEALGETPAPDEGFDYEGRGCNANVFRSNDLSFAPAHGLELTFSFHNQVTSNLFEGNAICGIWFGYARLSSIGANRFVANGSTGYGSERGGVNAEHAQRLAIEKNSFEENALGIRLWTDADPGIANLPWARANGQGARENIIARNLFDESSAVELRSAVDTTISEDLAPDRIDADAESRSSIEFVPEIRFTLASLGYPPPPPDWKPPPAVVPALDLETARHEACTELGVVPVALPANDPRRRDVRDRKWIVTTEWGPYDWTEPYLQPMQRTSAGHRYRLLGPPGTTLLDVRVDDGNALEVTVERGLVVSGADPDGIAAAVVTLTPKGGARVVPYRLVARAGPPFAGEDSGRELVREGVLVNASWSVRFATFETDPREDAAALRALLDAAEPVELAALRLDYGGGGPAEALGRLGRRAAQERVREAGVGADRFGTLAVTEVALPAGRWRIRTTSDDGIRVRADGELVIDDWTWHAPTRNDAVLELEEARTVRLEVEHFELDGAATLAVSLEPVP